MLFPKLNLYLMVLISLSVTLTGCFTAEVTEKIQIYGKYNPDQYPLTCKGIYFGYFDYKNVGYIHYYFPHFPWSPSLNHDTEMGVILAVNLEEEPIVLGLPKQYDYDRIHPTIVEYAYYNAKAEYKGKQEKRIIIPKSLGVNRTPAILIVNCDDTPPPISYPDEDVDQFVFLIATKNGPGSTFRIGQRVEDGSIEWSDQQTLNSVPVRTRWANCFDYSLYAIAVPLDIVTSPFYIFPALYSLRYGGHPY